MTTYLSRKRYEAIQHRIYESIARVPFYMDRLRDVNTRTIEEETGLSYDDSYELASKLGDKFVEKSRMLLELELEEYIDYTDLTEIFIRELHKVLSRDLYKIISEKCQIVF